MAFVSTYPVSLTYTYGPNVGTNNSVFNTSDGIYYSLNPLLSSVQDATFNQSSLNILSNSVLLFDSLSGNAIVDGTNYVTTSTISLNLNGVLNYLTTTGVANATIDVTTDITRATVFNITFNNDNTISLMFNGNYVSQTITNTLNMLAGYNGNGFNLKQTFFYNLHNSQISFFDHTGKVIYLLNSHLVGNTFNGFTSTNIFNIDRLSTTLYKKLGDTSNIKYNNKSNDITIQKVTDSLPHNYLITAAYGSINNVTNTLNYNLVPLKNYYSPQQLQTPALSTVSRIYNKLYTGLNTEKGNDKIYLSYLGQEITKTFAADADTYFHYPPGARSIPIESSTLAERGAMPGSSPWRSDRLFTKKANYGLYSNWGPHGEQQNGTYFCTWLSASEIGTKPVWMDRYFDPTSKEVNTKNVLTSVGASPSNNNYPNVIWDVPSTLYFATGNLYVLHNIGTNDNILIVDTLSSTLLHYIKKWPTTTSTSSTYSAPLVDSITGLSAGYVYNLTNSTVTTYLNTRDPALNTNSSYATLSLNNNDFYSPGFTLAFEAYNNDWSNIQGDQILGNFYDGGIGIFKNNPLLTPFVTIAGNEVKTLNTNLVNLYKTTTSTNPLTGSSFILKGSYNESFFIVDINCILYEYDQDGTKISQYNLYNSSDTFKGTLVGANLIFENGVRKILVVTNYQNILNWFKFDTNAVLLSYGANTNPVSYQNNYGLDLNNNIYYYYGSSSVVDSNNTVFALSGDKLVKGINTSNPQFILSACKAESISCDHKNNIWVLYSNNNLVKVDNYGRVVWDIRLTTSPAIDNTQNRIVNFTAEINKATNSLSYYGLILDGKTQNIFKVDPLSGFIINTLQFNSVSSTYVTSNVTLNCKPAGDTTGYDYQRKYKYIPDNSNSIKVKALIKNISVSTITSTTYEISYDATKLTSGWHHFAITVDPYNMFKLYIDGTMVNSTSIGNITEGIYRVFNKRNNIDLVIGTSSFKSQTLSLYTQQASDSYSFNGAIADIRFYSQALQKDDIMAILRRFKLNSFTDLVWSCPAGSRYYIEQIDRFFPHRLPGAKSHYFNIKIKNSSITDPTVRGIIEKNILASLNKTIPVYTQLNKIIWQ